MQDEPVTYEIRTGERCFQVELCVVECESDFVQVVVSVDYSPQRFLQFWSSFATSFIVSKEADLDGGNGCVPASSR